MKVILHEDISDFYDLAYPFLIKKEAENNLLFSILNTLKEDPERYGVTKPILIEVEEDDDIKLISIRTPPHNQILSFSEDLYTIDVLIEDFIDKKVEIPGVLGFKVAAEKFTKIWCKKNNLKPHIVRYERIYKLKEFARETLGNRKFIMGTNTHQSLILNWTKDFILEALPETKEAEIKNSQNRVRGDIENGKIFLLLDNDTIMSMARKAGKTPNGNLVNLVYTPPHLRRRGFATECVAHLSKQLLDEGNKFCFLFTDLMNPISNSIYQKIGYRPVIDIDQFEFLSK